jgi:hypothetical protein
MYSLIHPKKIVLLNDQNKYLKHNGNRKQRRLRRYMVETGQNLVESSYFSAINRSLPRSTNNNCRVPSTDKIHLAKQIDLGDKDCGISVMNKSLTAVNKSVVALPKISTGQ